MSKKAKEVKTEETLTENTTKETKQPEEAVKDDTKLQLNIIIDELNAKIINITKEKEELINKVKLAQADLVNYRVRKDEETANQLKYANKDLILELLPIVDNFERAIGNEKSDTTDEMKKYYDGIHMIYNGLKDALKKFGVEEINRVGEVFDPNLEQAILAENVPDKEDEIVLEVLQKGYKLKDRVIRPASVKINQK